MPSLRSRDARALYGEAGLMKSGAESAILEGTLFASVSQSVGALGEELQRRGGRGRCRNVEGPGYCWVTELLSHGATAQVVVQQGVQRSFGLLGWQAS